MLYRFALMTVFMVVCVFAQPAMAGDTKVGVVNVQKIMSESKAAQSIQSQLEMHRKNFQDEFSQHERELMEEEKALSEGRTDMDADEFSDKRQQFENQLLETRRLVQKRQRSLEEAAGDALNALRDKIIEIVADMADKEHYDLIVTRQNVILAQKEMDMTDAVMARLNKELQSIELKVDTN